MRAFVLTSDAYLHCLPPFCYLYNKAGLDKYPVVIAGYDAPVRPLPKNFAFHSIGRQEDYTWSSGLIALLDTIPDEHIVFMLLCCQD